MAFSSLLPPKANKSFSLSPHIFHPLITRQTQKSLYTTKLGKDTINNNNCNGELIYTRRLLLSPTVRTAAAAMAAVSDEGKDDVPPVAVAKRRKWNELLKYMDSEPASPEGAALLGITHLLCLFAPFSFSWDAVGVAFGLAVITGLGVTLSYHRNLAHRSFKLRPKWLEYLFAYCGVHALQGNPIDWVRTHRNHHQYCDSEKDPHSPIQGFWYSHIGWLFDFNSTHLRSEMPSNVKDLENQFFYKFIQHTYIIHPIILATLLYVIGGLRYIIWGMGVRTAVMFHITFLVNSACHLWGNQAWDTGDLSRNNWFLALLTFGESWHNNHHAFEFSARHGLHWWQLDITWYIIWLLQTFGLATDVKLPTNAQKKKMLFNHN